MTFAEIYIFISYLPTIVIAQDEENLRIPMANLLCSSVMKRTNRFSEKSEEKSFFPLSVAFSDVLEL